MRWRRLTSLERLGLAGLAFGLLLTIAVAHRLTPDARGLGTHEQLGLAPCFTARFFRFPCPFCGMTTAFALMAHGHIRTAFLTQPAGAMVFGGAGVTVAFCVAFALLGRGPAGLAENQRLRRSWVPVLALLILAWIYKIVIHLAWNA